jgi:hypothetical protein
MTDDSYLRGLSEEKLLLEYSTWITHKGKKKWNSLVMVELKRRGVIRKAKEFHKKRMGDREAGILEVRKRE